MSSERTRRSVIRPGWVLDLPKFLFASPVSPTGSLSLILTLSRLRRLFVGNLTRNPTLTPTPSAGNVRPPSVPCPSASDRRNSHRLVPFPALLHPLPAIPGLGFSGASSPHGLRSKCFWADLDGVGVRALTPRPCPSPPLPPPAPGRRASRASGPRGPVHCFDGHTAAAPPRRAMDRPPPGPGVSPPVAPDDPCHPAPDARRLGRGRRRRGRLGVGLFSLCQPKRLIYGLRVCDYPGPGPSASSALYVSRHGSSRPLL